MHARVSICVLERVLVRVLVHVRVVALEVLVEMISAYTQCSSCS